MATESHHYVYFRMSPVTHSQIHVRLWKKILINQGGIINMKKRMDLWHILL